MDATYPCRQEGCEAMFTHATNRSRHERTTHGNRLHSCNFCPATFARSDKLACHERSRHSGTNNCDQCEVRCATSKALKQHKEEYHHHKPNICDVCGQKFKRPRSLRDHLKFEHGPDSDEVTCTECGVLCVNRLTLKTHQQCKHGIQKGAGGPNMLQSAFKGFLKLFRYTPLSVTKKRSHPNDDDDDIRSKRHKSDQISDIATSSTDPQPSTSYHSAGSINLEESRTTNVDLNSFLSEKKTYILKDLYSELDEDPIKFFMTIKCLLYKRNPEGKTIEASPVFQSKPKRVIEPSDLPEALDSAYQEVIKAMENYQRNGSGWVFDSVVECDVHVGKYIPIPGSAYKELPSQLKDKRALLNIKNDDDYCFIYCILAALNPVKHHDASSIRHYKKYVQIINNIPIVEGIDVSGLEFPMKTSNITKFESMNQNICINVYGCAFEKKEWIIYPLRISAKQNTTVINLLYMSDDGPNTHYILIKSLDRLLNRRKPRRTLHYCPYCLHGYIRQDLLTEHIPYCSVHSPQRIEMPPPNKSTMYFKDGDKQLPAPYIMVADFECSIVKQNDGKDKHVPNSFCLYKVAYNPTEYFEPIVYVGEDAPEIFADTVDKETTWILSKQEEHKQLNRDSMTDEEKENYAQAVTCHICSKSVNGDDKVRDHCHVTGKYRGAAHSKCNLRYKLPQKIPLFLHNFSKYDLKLIVEGIRKTTKKISIIPENMECYMAMDVGNVRYLDSYRFLDASLDSLVQKMKDSGAIFEHTTNWLQIQGLGEYTHMLLQKSAYPYEWVNSIDKLNEVSFPSKSDFYSKLRDSTVTDELYEHAQTVYASLKMKSFMEFHRLYLTLDVLLLADVFTNFRQRCLKDDGLDPANYFTMPNYSFEAMLKSTGVKLELLQDPTMYLTFENNIRGGISTISHRQATANNPYLSDYDPKQPTSYLLYVDAVSLYGYAMSQNLPQGNFRWLTDEEISEFDVTKVEVDGDKCYFVEVDLDYPSHLHAAHSDYPMAPEAMVVHDEMLSPYCSSLKNKLALGKPTKKLIPNLYPKKKYLCHVKNLKFYVKHGLIITKIHRVIECTQSKWLQPFIDANTAKRKIATSTIDKDFFKKKTNANFGKCIMNPRKYQRVELVNNVKRVRKLVADPTYLSHKVFFGDEDGDSMAAIHRQQTTLKLNKPIYAGFAILELSKLLMFQYFYDYLKPKYGENITLCFTDTDSFLIHVHTPDIYRDMQSDCHLYDLSDYPATHFLHSTANKKVPGCFSDETITPIKSWVGLRSKMYAIKLDDGDEKRRAKGIPRRLVQNSITYDDYVECLNSANTTSVQYCTIQSKNMKLYTTEIHKTALSSYDDKRYILDDGKTTLAYGHTRITP